MTCVLLWLGLASILTSAVYIFLIWNFDYWRKRGVKGPKPLPFLGSFPSMVTLKQHMSYDMQEIYEKFKNDEDFVGVHFMRTPQLMMLSPELIHKVYVTDFRCFMDNEASTYIDRKKDRLFAENPFLLRGEKWKQCRKDIMPAFSPNRVKAVQPVTQNVCKRLVNYVTRRSAEIGSDGIDTKELSLRFTSEVVSDCVLGVEANCFTDTPTPILSFTKTLFQISTPILIYQVLAGLLPQIKDIFKIKFLKCETDLFFFDLLKSAFVMRRRHAVARNDLMNYLLQLQEKRNLTDEQLTSYSMTFLLDGFETMASVIAHCLLQLARKPSAQDLLLNEINSNLNEKGEIDFEKLNELPYLDQCLHESIRLLPPLVWSQKIVTEPIELTNRNGSKLQLNVNDVVILPIYSIHHDSQFYPDPEEFIPERFSANNGGTKRFQERGIFYPFGDGPRTCLGKRFALVQTKSAIVEMVRNFHLKVNPKTRNDNRLNSTGFIGELMGGVFLDFEKRI